MTESPLLSDRMEEFKALVRSAFHAARSSGKQDWRIMTTPVLKNRLLQLTHGDFNETTYGEGHLLPLLRAIPEVVELTEEPGRPWRVRLLDVSTSGSPTDDLVGRTPTVEHSNPQNRKIRPDLWKGILDYSSNTAYVLDPESKTARLARVEDGVSDLVLPTLTREELQNWRHEFISSLGILGDADVQRLNEWLEGAGRTVDLPSRLRGDWNAYLKSRVLSRLREWYGTRSIPVPVDLLVDPRKPNSALVQSVASEQMLRDALITAIQLMDYESLLRVSVPATALLGSPRPRGSDGGRGR